MTDPFLDLTPRQAVERAGERPEDPEAWEYLDRYLRWRLLAYLQDREGEVAELRSALVAATKWARSADDTEREAAWRQLLELLRDAERTPATAADLEALRRPKGRAAELLAAVVEPRKPVRPRDLAGQLGMSRQQVGNLSRKLEAAGLIARQRGEGRSSWIFATARGLRLATLLPAGDLRTPGRSKSEKAELDSGKLLWHPAATDRAVNL